MDPAEVAPLVCAGVTVFNSVRNQGAFPGDIVAVQGIGGGVTLLSLTSTIAESRFYLQGSAT
jgi:D-arabinose 1-dehydrogenase-like Zn-dependent alcohol dehydrogenase